MEQPTTDALAHAIDGLHAVENGVRFRLLEKIVEVDRLAAWKEDGATSMTDWVAFRLGYSHKVAAEMVRTAWLLTELPLLAEAFSSGQISFEKVALVASVATPESDAVWAEEAISNNVARLASWVRESRRMNRREAEAKLKQRYLRKYWDEHEGVLHLIARIPGADGAVVAKTIDRLVEQAPPEHEDGTYEPHESRCADALVAACSAHIAADADADRATVVVHVDAKALNAIHGTATIEDGPLIASEVVRRLSCDARLQLVIESGRGEPIGVGRTTRTIPPYLGRELRRRDRGCRFGDCGRTRGVQGHHIHHYAHGGPTTLDNLVLLCPYHHRLVHDGGWRLLKDGADRLRFLRPDGRPLRIRPSPLRPHLRERMFGPPRSRAGPQRR